MTKNNKLSNRLREIGNKNYLLGNSFDALLKFNESLCFAITGSTSMGLAYANRSAVYMDLKLYKNCMSNITLARKNGYPEEKMKKLAERENRCIRLMSLVQEPLQSPWDFFKLSYEPNPKIPFFASCLEMRDHKELGPHLITNRDLKSGDFIAITDGALKYVDPIARLHRCSWCVGDFLLDLIPCTGCPMAMFCSDECFKKGKHYFHYKQCDHFMIDETEKGKVEIAPKSFVTNKIFSRLIAMFDGDLSNCWKFMESKGSKAWNYFDFDWSAMDKDSYEKNLLLISLSKHKNRLNMQNYIPDASKPITFMDCLKDAALKMSLIELVLSRFISVPGEKSTTGEHESQEIYESAIVSNLIGYIMSPIQCFTTISCAPNTENLIIDNKMILMVLRPIKAGEKITVGIGPTFVNSTKQTRRELSLRFFGRPCKCIACVGDWQQIYTNILKMNASTCQEKAIWRFILKTKDINKFVSEKDPTAIHWGLLNSILLDAKILAKPASFYP